MIEEICEWKSKQLKKMIAQFDYDYPDKQISFAFFDTEILSKMVQKQVHREIC